MPVGAMYVRDPHRMAADTRPVDTYPEGVICRVSDDFDNSLRTFTYELRAGVWLRHLFTCNRLAFQKRATDLFVKLQLQFPIKYQEVKSAVAAGACFFLS